MADIDINHLRSWIGRQESRCDLITAAPLACLGAALDRPACGSVTGAGAGEPLPPLWHWLYFLPAPPASQLDIDGHALRGDFLPPVPLPRRMWAGSNIRFESAPRVGDPLRRVSTIADVSHKQGSSGELVFVTVRHEVFSAATLALTEEQQLVYRDQSGGISTRPALAAPAAAQWSRELVPDPVLLFRYSALTFNRHRIHYDRDYAVAIEGYAGLVVQGPLTATLLLDTLHRHLPGKRLASFRFRGVKPLLDGQPIQLQGRRDGDTVSLWALDSTGALAMQANAELA